MSSSTPTPQTVLFARGILARLTLWPALRLAVHQSWGGPESAEKQRWLAGVLVDQFEDYLGVLPPSSSSSTQPSSSASKQPPPTSTQQPPPDAPYIEDLLLQILADEFDVSLEDDSASAVARDIIKLFNEISAGSAGGAVNELEEQADRVRGRVPRHEVGAGSESEGEWESDGDDSEEEGLDAEGGEGEEVVPQLMDRRREEPEVDEEGFTMVKKGRR
ncbi:hypothetical protein HYDPIDRAFT_116484 [Hydnomerulius pinastri MD-312]|uniref:Pre-rRNA-processing protein TSR2 n=1 Tax=Hydnomerulius pinastri MD-312 TaxID=994086 RepID=A0A0C9W3V5_9AGAM|nr:hypothetical protein HYDPIDRAFT_116484 [Hydnomerulius pinastri MD-312]